MEIHLHQKQGIAFQTRATELLYGGAAGGGKSHLMRSAAISWCTAIPGLQVYLFRRTRPDLMKNHMTGPTGFPAMLADWTKRGWVKFNYTDNYIQFWHGAKIFLCHCQYEHDVYNYQGAEIHVLLMDELTHFMESQYRFLRGRCRLGGLQVPQEFAGMFPRIINGSNPGNIGHNWVKQMFVDYAPPMEIKRASPKEGGMMRQFIPALLNDNPTLVQNDPDYEQRLDGLGSPELVRAMKEGDWDIVAGGMFDDVWKRDIHVIEPFDIPFSWYIDRSFDWGSSKPFSVGFWAESDGTEAPNGIVYPPGTLFRIDEWYGWNERVNEGLKMRAIDVAEGVKKLEANMPYKVNPGPADTSIWNPEKGRDSIADDFEKVGIKWRKADKSPGSRKIGWQKLRDRLAAAKQEHLEEPPLYVFKNCTQWIRTVPVVPRDERDPDDVNTKVEDHAADETRYRLMQRRSSIEQAGSWGIPGMSG